MLLIAAGLLALLAGFVWGIVTGSHPKPPPGPLVRATASATPISPAQLGQYRATHVRARVRPAGILVTWSAPTNTDGVNAYLIIPKVPGQQTQSVGRSARSVIFDGLPAGHRYCFVVVTLIESADGQASTAATHPVCTPARPSRSRARRTHHHRLNALTAGAAHLERAWSRPTPARLPNARPAPQPTPAALPNARPAPQRPPRSRAQH